MALFARTQDNELIKVIRAGHTINNEMMVLTEREWNSVRMYKFVGPSETYTEIVTDSGEPWNI
jgi:hypothetical protein